MTSLERYWAATSGYEILSICVEHLGNPEWPDHRDIVYGAAICAVRVLHLTGKGRREAENAIAMALGWTINPFSGYRLRETIKAGKIALEKSEKLRTEYSRLAMFAMADLSFSANNSGAAWGAEAALCAKQCACAAESSGLSREGEEMEQARLLRAYFSMWPALKIGPHAETEVSP